MTERKVRLLYVVNIPRFFVSHRLPLALAARDASYDVHVATSDADTENIQIIQASGLPFHPLPLSQHGTNPLQELQTIRALIRLYRTLRPDIVHHVSIKPILYGGIAARIAGVKAVVGTISGLGYIFSQQGTKPLILRTIIKPMYKAVLRSPQTCLIFQNHDNRDLFVKLKLVNPGQTVVIRGSGVDVQHFTPQPEPNGKPVVLFAARLLWEKGIGEFVAVARNLGDKARFVVAGYPEPSSPNAAPISQIDEWVNDGIIEFWGNQDDMPAVFAQSNIVCLPSTYGEGVPKVLIEAAACGRASITTDTPGCREIVRHEVNGLLVPASDVSALQRATERLIDGATLRQQMGIRARDIAVNEFSLERVVQETFAVYDELLKVLS